MNLSKFPKIELHLHLDCSLSYSVVQKLRPGTSETEYQQSFIGPPKCTDLADFLTQAINAIDLLQTEEALRLATLDLFEQLQFDNVIYAEIRFAPLLHTERELKPAQVVQIVNDAVAEGITKTGIQAGLILCTLRHYQEEQSIETVKLVELFKGTHVLGFDIAADEAGYPIDAHISAFQYAKAKNIACTAHAGEAKGADSVWETLQCFHPDRIGHGVRSIEDPNLLAYLKEKNIHLEICLTSNIQTSIYESINNHPANQLFESGVSMSINTDARTICDVTLAQEYQNLQQLFAWDKAHFLRCNLEAIEHAFTSAEVKNDLRKQILKAWS